MFLPFLLLLLPHLGLSLSDYYLSPQVGLHQYQLVSNKLSSREIKPVQYPQGSDSWDGSSPTHSPGTNIGPWETLQHAIEALRFFEQAQIR